MVFVRKKQITKIDDLGVPPFMEIRILVKPPKSAAQRSIALLRFEQGVPNRAMNVLGTSSVPQQWGPSLTDINKSSYKFSQEE